MGLLPCETDESERGRKFRGRDVTTARKRILSAAFMVFTENGYAGTSTLEIAARAKVSKRELYALIGNKTEMLAACIAAWVTRIRLPHEVPAPRDGEMLSNVLVRFGTALLREVCQPAVLAVFRLAIAEGIRSPKVAQVLDLELRQANFTALGNICKQGQAAGLLETGDSAEMAAQFQALLWRDLMVELLLRLVPPPSPAELERRALNAATAFLTLYSKAGRAFHEVHD